MRSLRFFNCDSRVDRDDTEDAATEVYVYGCSAADMLDSSAGEPGAWY